MPAVQGRGGGWLPTPLSFRGTGTPVPASFDERQRLRPFGAPVELPEGSYRLMGADLKVTDAAGGSWRYPFSGRGGEIVVRPDETTEAPVLAPVGCRLSIAGELTPGETIRVTVVMPSAEGLSLGQATRGGETIAARAWLIDPEGKVAASADAGFG